MNKKVISTLLVFCIIMAFIPTSFAQSDNNVYVLETNVYWIDANDFSNEYKYYGFDKLLIEGEVTTYEYYENIQTRKVVIKSENNESVIIFDKVSGDLLFNNKILGGTIKNDSSVAITDTNLLDNNVLREGHEWVYFDSDEGSVSGYVLTTAAVVGAIAAILGISSSSAGILTLASLIIAGGLKKIWYTVDKYYKSPITTSRPILANVFRFYSDSGHRNQMGNDFDFRY